MITPPHTFLKKALRYAGLCLALHCGLLAPLPTRAAPVDPPKPVLFQILSLNSSVSGLFYDLKGKAVPLQASTSELSQLYETDVSKSVLIYRLAPAATPDLPPVKSPVAKLQLSEHHPHLLLMTGSPDPAKISVVAVEDSWTIHPEKTFRILNTSKRNIAVQLGAEDVIITAGQSYVFQSPGRGYDFDFKMASWEGDRWTLRVQAPQSILPRTRATVVVSDPPPTASDPNPADLNIVSVFDAKQLTQAAPQQIAQSR